MVSVVCARLPSRNQQKYYHAEWIILASYYFEFFMILWRWIDAGYQIHATKDKPVQRSQCIPCEPWLQGIWLYSANLVNNPVT